MNKVFTYIINMEQYYHNIPLYWSYLSLNEQKQAKSYYNQLLTDRYIISHGILRYILGYYVDQPAYRLEFVNNEYGKPFLKGHNIQFNMAHSNDVVCYVVTFKNNVGIDIEFYDNTFDIIAISTLVLTKQEIELLQSLNSEEKYKTFYTLWTKKEALVKTMGKGLSYPVNTISAIKLLSCNHIFLTDEDSKLQKKWYCYELKTSMHYFGSIGAENKIDEISYATI